MIVPGAVVFVDFPGVQGVKPRPGIVISTAAYHLLRPDVIVALCTSKVAKATQPTDYLLRDCASAGLHVPTVYRSFFATLQARGIQRIFGRVSDRDWAEIQARLRLALAVT